jgi:flagellar biosynthesis protein FliP
MVTENEKWEEAKKQAKDFINKQTWSNNIRFLMTLRNEIQKILNQHEKEIDKKHIKLK